MYLAAVSIAVALMLFASAPNRLSPAPEMLAPWTTALRDSQPADAYGAVYAMGDKKLVFLAAVHSTKTDSLTFKVINDAYDAFDFDIAIVEGFPTSRGPNAERLLDYARNARAENGFQARGETVPAVLGALKEGATVLGGEPDDSDIRDALLSSGFDPEDLLGFYTLRTIPQWIRQEKINAASDLRIAALLEGEIEHNRERLALDADVLPTSAAWDAWYARTNGKPFGDDFESEEAGPLADGPYGSNRIAAAISRARGAFLHNLIIERLNAGDNVLVVFGGSHYLIHRPALDRAIGAPCYLGAGMAEAPVACEAE